MAADRNTLIQRIVKLFRLGSADAKTTEHEMMLAITKAKRMMAEHAITLAEVERASGDGDAARIRITLKQHVAYTRKIRDLAHYDYLVAKAVEILTTTRAIVVRSSRGGSHWTQMQFIGETTDAELAGELFIIILESVRRASRQTYGGGWSKSHTSYALGFGTRLVDRAKEIIDLNLSQQQTQIVALVVASKGEAIQKWMDENTKERKQRRTDIDALAWHRGYRDGGSFNLTTQTFRQKE